MLALQAVWFVIVPLCWSLGATGRLSSWNDTIDFWSNHDTLVVEVEGLVNKRFSPYQADLTVGTLLKFQFPYVYNASMALSLSDPCCETEIPQHGRKAIRVTDSAVTVKVDSRSSCYYFFLDGNLKKSCKNGGVFTLNPHQSMTTSTVASAKHQVLSGSISYLPTSFPIVTRSASSAKICGHDYTTKTTRNSDSVHSQTSYPTSVHSQPSGVARPTLSMPTRTGGSGLATLPVLKPPITNAGISLRAEAGLFSLAILFLLFL